MNEEKCGKQETTKCENEQILQEVNTEKPDLLDNVMTVLTE